MLCDPKFAFTEALTIYCSHAISTVNYNSTVPNFIMNYPFTNLPPYPSAAVTIWCQKCSIYLLACEKIAQTLADFSNASTTTKK